MFSFIRSSEDGGRVLGGGRGGGRPIGRGGGRIGGVGPGEVGCEIARLRSGVGVCVGAGIEVIGVFADALFHNGPAVGLGFEGRFVRGDVGGIAVVRGEIGLGLGLELGFGLG